MTPPLPEDDYFASSVHKPGMNTLGLADYKYG